MKKMHIILQKLKLLNKKYQNSKNILNNWNMKSKLENSEF